MFVVITIAVLHRGVIAGEQGVTAANNVPAKGLEDGVTALRLEAP